MLRTVRNQLTFVLVGILILAATSVLLTYRRTADHSLDHNAQAVVAYQREIVQQIVLVAIAEPASSELDRLIDAFQDNMRVLENGGVAAIGDHSITLAPEDDPLVYDQLGTTLERWQAFRDDVTILNELQATDPAFLAALHAVRDGIPSLAASLDRVTTLYSEHMERELQQLKAIQTALIAGASALLIIGIVLLRHRIAKPMDAFSDYFRRGMASSPDVEVPEEAYADEVRALLASFDAIRIEFENVRTLNRRTADPQLDQVSAALELSQEIVQTIGWRELVPLVAKSAKGLLDADSAALCLVQPNGGLLELVSGEGKITDDVVHAAKNGSALPSVGLVGAIDASRRQSLCIGCRFFEAGHDENTLTRYLGTSKSTFGFLCVTRKPERPFTAGDRQALSLLSNSASVAILNAYLTERNQVEIEQAAIESERRRLAADVHDTLAQTLAYLRLRATRAREIIASTESAEALAEIDFIRSATDIAYGQVRMVLDQVSVALTSAAVPWQELQTFIGDFQEATGLNVDVALEEEAANALSPLVQQQVVYIVREAMTNANRHAQASNLWVKLFGIKDAVTISVQDDGIGFDTEKVNGDNHLGLKIIRTRVRRCHGELRIESQQGKGTLILATFPRKSVSSMEHLN